MALTELAVRSAKADGKITKLSDGGGLQLWVTPDGAKRWRLAYRFAGGQKVLAIGVYPTIGLKEARIARQNAKKLLARGKRESTKRLRATIGQVFRYAVATGRADSDPTGALAGALASPIVRHRAAIVEPKGFGALLFSIATYEGSPETLAALELLALTFVRPGELRAAEWTEFDLEGAVWSIPAEKMKMRRPHRVPLAPRALVILRDLQAITGTGRFLFPSVRSATRCMSENTINAALRRLGFKQDEMTAHGFRSAASSILNERGLWNPDAIERQLAHVDNDSVRRAYARADFWEERIRMMVWWADKCDELRRGGIVVPLRA